MRTEPMAKGNPLQEQLLKAGLVKKSKVSEVARAQVKARHGKAPPTAAEIQREAERVRAGKIERDRQLEAERRNAARVAELRAQAKQIICDKQVPRTGQLDYRFTVDGTIRSLLVDEAQRKALASGALVIARIDDRFELLPRAAGDKVRERDASMVVLDHAQGTAAEASTSEDDAYYAQFVVPDDLVW